MVISGLGWIEKCFGMCVVRIFRSAVNASWRLPQPGIKTGAAVVEGIHDRAGACLQHRPPFPPCLKSAHGVYRAPTSEPEFRGLICRPIIRPTPRNQ